jgi:hypothetical protein
MTETREQIEARHAREIAEWEAREREPEPDALLKQYDAAVAKQYSLGGYSTGHGVGRIAPHRERLEQAEEVKKLRTKLVAALAAAPLMPVDFDVEALANKIASEHWMNARGVVHYTEAAIRTTLARLTALLDGTDAGDNA